MPPLLKLHAIDPRTNGKTICGLDWIENPAFETTYLSKFLFDFDAERSGRCRNCLKRIENVVDGWRRRK